MNMDMNDVGVFEPICPTVLCEAVALFNSVQYPYKKRDIRVLAWLLVQKEAKPLRDMAYVFLMSSTHIRVTVDALVKTGLVEYVVSERGARHYKVKKRLTHL